MSCETCCRPDLSERQIEAGDEKIEYVEDELQPGGPKAVAVILHKLAACVAMPAREQWDIAAEAYVEDLSEYPADILDDVAVEWRRTEKFWPTIAELRERCKAHRSLRRKAATCAAAPVPVARRRAIPRTVARGHARMRSISAMTM